MKTNNKDVIKATRFMIVVDKLLSRAGYDWTEKIQFVVHTISKLTQLRLEREKRHESKQEKISEKSN